MDFADRQTDFPPDHAFNHATGGGPDPRIVEARRSDRDKIAELVAGQVGAASAAKTEMIDATAGQPQMITDTGAPAPCAGFGSEEHRSRTLNVQAWTRQVCSTIGAHFNCDSLVIAVALDPKQPIGGFTSIGMASAGDINNIVTSASMVVTAIRKVCELRAASLCTTGDAMFAEVIAQSRQVEFK